jgi:RNA polymerase sigma-70 factor (ECF subfamily)
MDGDSGVRPDSEPEETVREALRREIHRLLRLAERLSGNRRDAEDLVQEALFRAVRKDPDLGDPGRRRAWLARILVNLWRDRLRARARRRESPPGSPVPDVQDRGAGPEAVAMGAELRERVRAALVRLPPLQKAAMLLAVDEGLSVAEIAAALGSTADRVKANLWQARRKMKDELGDLIGGGS